jgi:hypothetical protein
VPSCTVKPDQLDVALAFPASHIDPPASSYARHAEVHAPTAERIMDPARMFEGELDLTPELENTREHIADIDRRPLGETTLVTLTVSRHCIAAFETILITRSS